EEDIRVRRGDEEVFHEVLRLGAEGRDAAPAPPLAAVRSDGQPLDVPVVGQGDDDVLFGDEVLDVEVLFRRRGDLGAAGIVVLLLDLQQLVFDDGVPLLVVLQDGTQVRDGLEQLLVLGFDLLPLKAGEAAELHVEDGHRLALRQPEALHELHLGRLVAVGVPDQLDDLVDVVQRDAVPFQDVGPLFRPPQFKAGAASDDLPLVIEVVLQHRLEVEHFGLPVYQREHDDAERLLELRVFQQLVQDDVGVDVPPQLDDDPHAGAIGLVPQRGEGVDLPLAGELGDLSHQRRLVNHVRDLGDDDPVPAPLEGLDPGAGRHGQAPAAGLGRVPDPFAAQDQRAGGKVRAFDVLHQVGHGGIRVVDELYDGVDHFA